MVIKSKRLTIFAIIFSIVLSGLTSVYAEDEYIQGFKKVNTYTNGQFFDVKSEWFSASVQQAYEIGLMYGDSQNTFNPSGNIDNASVITIAARLHSIYKSDNAKFDSGSSNWYEPYINYAVNNGICDSDINPKDIATRSFFVGILGNAVDDSILQQKNKISSDALSDVSGWYSNTVYAFYRAGILCGNDEYGTFAPDSHITRAEVAAIVMRLVKPSERLEISLSARPTTSTYSIMEDDGSLAAYRQRAILANLKVLLNGETPGNEWQNDVWKSEHAEIPGNDIYVRSHDIETRANSSDFFEVWIPNRYLDIAGDAYTRVGDWSLYIGFRSYMSGYTGSMPDGLFGDLYLTKPAVAGYTETHTYSEYTGEAQSLIDAVSYTPIIDSAAVKDYINENYGSSDLSVIIGYLTDWENDWYITYNKNNMYNPTPREGGNTNQEALVFTPENTELKQWCQNNFGKYVVAVVPENLHTPVFLAEISGYSLEKEDTTIRSWDYSDNKLTIQWNNQVSFSNPIVVYEQNKLNDMMNVDGLVPVSAYYTGFYPVGTLFAVDSDEGKSFGMLVKGDNIKLSVNEKTIQLTLYSDKAVVDGVKEYTVTAPKKLYDTKNQQFVYYLPLRFIEDTLFNDKSTGNTSSSTGNASSSTGNASSSTGNTSSSTGNTSSSTGNDSSIKTEDEYIKAEEKQQEALQSLIDSGYAKVCVSSGSEWASYLEGHNKEKFRFGKREGIEGYEYEISHSSKGPHIGFNLGSNKACIQVWYNGTEYGEKVITIPEPKEINGDIYLPADEIIDALNEDGQGFDRKKI